MDVRLGRWGDYLAYSQPGGTKTAQQALLSAISSGKQRICLVAGYSVRQGQKVFRDLAEQNGRTPGIAGSSRAIDRGFLCTSTVARDAWFASLRSDPRYAPFIQDAEHRRSATHEAFRAAGGVQVISIA